MGSTNWRAEAKLIDELRRFARGEGLTSPAGARLGSPRQGGFGSCCISERCAIEMIDDGGASTPYLSFGERMRMVAVAEELAVPLFGLLDRRETARSN